MQEDPADVGSYDLVPEASPQAPKPSPPVVVEPIVPKTLGYRTAATQPAAPAEPETIKNLYMPLWLLGAGVAIECIAAFFSGRSLEVSLARVGIDIVLGTILMLVGILIAARVRQIDLGNFWTAVLKLAAISVAPSAAFTLASPLLNNIPFGFILGLLGQFVLYFALLGALFDLDESDTWYCVMVIFLVRLAVYFGFKGAIWMWG